MSYVKLSSQANIDLERLYRFLAKFDLSTADHAIETILNAFGLLESLPTGCPFVPGRKDIRKLVIAFGAKGYLAFYEYDPHTDIATIATILHQLEDYDEQTIGKPEPLV
jgi:plasmid stabilization system protein ParE